MTIHSTAKLFEDIQGVVAQSPEREIQQHVGTSTSCGNQDVDSEGSFVG